MRMVHETREHVPKEMRLHVMCYSAVCARLTATVIVKPTPKEVIS